MNMTRVDGSNVRTTKGDRKTIYGERVTPTIAFALSEGFEERWSGVPPVASVRGSRCNEERQRAAFRSERGVICND